MLYRKSRRGNSDFFGIVWLLLLSILLASCSTPSNSPPSNSPPSTPQGYLRASHDAIERKDWQAAYRLIEDSLGSSDADLHKAAMSLVDQYPQIREAAFETFSKESLEHTLLIHGEGAKSIEKDRLSIYQRTIATPEQYATALNNYQIVYGHLIGVSENQSGLAREALEQKEKLRRAFDLEVAEALAGAPTPLAEGNTHHLLGLLTTGNTSRKQSIAMLGEPESCFDSYAILTWPLRIEEDNYTVLRHFVRSQEGVTHSLILMFDLNGLLTDRSLVRIVK